MRPLLEHKPLPGPYGWIALAVEAIVAAVIASIVAAVKAGKKVDKKLNENGINLKGLPALLVSSPVLAIGCIIIGILLIFMLFMMFFNTASVDRIEMMQEALICFETSGAGEGCEDFRGTGITLGKKRLYYFPLTNTLIAGNSLEDYYAKGKNGEPIPLIKRTDKEIAWFVSDYLLIERALLKDMEFDLGFFKPNDFGLAEMFDDTTVYDETAFKTDMENTGLLTKNDDVTDDNIRTFDRARYLFKWLKMEKRIFNQIQWNYVSIHRSSVDWLNRLSDDVNYVKLNALKKDPAEALNKAIRERKYSVLELTGFEANLLTTAYLRVPRELKSVVKDGDTVDYAINLAQPYIPSFMEVYATYMTTSNYKLADEIYNYYVSNIRAKGKMPIVINIYEQITLDTIKSDTDSISHTEKYYVTTTGKDSGWNEISKSEYENLENILDKETKLDQSIDEAEAQIIKAKDWLENTVTNIRNKLGWDTTVTREYAAVVVQGHAYEYIASREYSMLAETYEAEQLDAPKEQKTQKVPEQPMVISDKNSKYYAKKVQLKVVSDYTWDQKHTITQSLIRPVSSDIEKYKVIENDKETELDNRYLWVLDQIETEQRTKYEEQYKIAEEEGKLKEFLESYEFISTSDAMFAVDIIEKIYSETFGLSGGVTIDGFTEAGEFNTSLINYAKQFDGYTLKQMKAVDDENVFFNGHWCAMFVSFCMKKANAKQDTGIPVFYNCTQFWSKYKDKTGFIDIIDSNHNGYITKNVEHRGSLNNIQPGDIVLFKWADSPKARSHTGICSEVYKNDAGDVIKVVVIEGNTGGSTYNNSKVSIKTYKGAGLKQIVSYVSVSTVLASGGW